MTKKTTDALEILDRRRKPTKRILQLREQARVAGDVAQVIYDARTEAGLSQRELAELVGTTASTICRLEDADYGSHTLSMLRRISTALGKQVKVEFVDLPKKRAKRGVRRPGKALAK